jgi:hypothetical protein
MDQDAAYLTLIFRFDPSLTRNVFFTYPVNKPYFIWEVNQLQDRNVRKDFDITKEAGGPKKATNITQEVTVDNSMLVIHLYWSGRGTCCIPYKGAYGPLVSAIKGSYRTCPCCSVDLSFCSSTKPLADYEMLDFSQLPSPMTGRSALHKHQVLILHGRI